MSLEAGRSAGGGGSWEGRSVLVTGGAGFIGSNLVGRLVELGARVRVADNLRRGSLKNLRGCLQDVHFMHCDLTDPEACRRACAGVDTVVHLAAKVGGIGYYLSRPAEVMSHNVLVDALVWRAARDGGVRRYVYASSAHVYPLRLQGTPDAPALREEQALPADPPLSYGWAKLAGERQLHYAAAEGCQTHVGILRLAGVYGPGQDCDLASGSAIPVFVRRAIEYPQRGPFTVMGTGEETRSYCCVGDVVEAVLLTLERLDGEKVIGPMNVGGEGRVSIGDLAREVVSVSGKRIDIEFDGAQGTEVRGQAVDCARARSLLGWAPAVPLRRGLEMTYADIERRLGAAVAVSPERTA